MTRVVNAAVVGVGHFGRHHARHYASRPDVALVAVVDRDTARAAEIASAHGAQVFSSVDELAASGLAVDCASVATPTTTHHATTARLIDRGIDVLVEKPIADTVAHAEDLVRRAAARGVILQVGHIERFSAAYRALASAIDHPLFVEARRMNPASPRTQDVDVVMDLMIHDIDLVLDLVGAPVVEVSACGAAYIGAATDICHARLVFADGRIADLIANRVAEALQRTLRVHAEGGFVVADLADLSLTSARAVPVSGRAPEIVTTVVPRTDSLAAEIEAFVSSVRTRALPRVGGRAGTDALRIAQAIADDVATRRRERSVHLAVSA